MHKGLMAPLPHDTFSPSSQLTAWPLVATSYRYSVCRKERTTLRVPMCSRCAHLFVTLLNTSMAYYTTKYHHLSYSKKVSGIFLYLDFVIGGFDMAVFYFLGVALLACILRSLQLT